MSIINFIKSNFLAIIAYFYSTRDHTDTNVTFSIKMVTLGKSFVLRLSDKNGKIFIL